MSGESSNTTKSFASNMMMTSARCLCSSVSNMAAVHSCTQNAVNGARKRARLVVQRVLPLHSLQQSKVGKHLARAKNDRCQRIVRDEHRQTGLGAQSLVEILQQCAAAGQHHTAIDNVGRKF